MSGLVDTILSSNNTNDVRVLVSTRQVDLSSCCKFKVLQFLATLAQEKSVVFTGNLDLNVGLKIRSTMIGNSTNKSTGDKSSVTRWDLTLLSNYCSYIALWMHVCVAAHNNSCVVYAWASLYIPPESAAL